MSTAPLSLARRVRRWFGGAAAAPPPALSPTHTARLLGAARRLLQQRQALYQQLRQRQQPRARADLRRWREALAAWAHPQRPNPRPLLQLVDDALLDAHLAALVHTRRQRIAGASLQLLGPEGAPDAAALRALSGPWLQQALAAAFDAALYGYSLLELVPDAATAGGLRAQVLPRAHVLPQAGLVCLDGAAEPPELDPEHPLTSDELADAGWWRLRELEPHALALLTVEGARPGLLHHAIPYVVMKRHALASWSEFAEVFGMPLRVARTPAHDPERKRQLAELLKGMGSAAYVVLDEGEQIELNDSSRPDAYRVYDRLVERCNQELSKLLHGQTLTTEAGDRGARSLGEIHDRIFDDLTRADAERIEQQLNAQVMPLLARFAHTAPYAQHRIAISRRSATLSPAEQWQVDRGLLEHFDIDPAYFSRTYGVPVRDRRARPNAPAADGAAGGGDQP